MLHATRTPAVLLALCLALVAAGCGDEKESGIGAGQKPTEKRADTSTQKAATPERQAGAVAAATGTPKIVSPKGSPPTQLQVKDLKKGTGATAKNGDQVEINYAGALYGSGKQFDSSFSRGQPLPFQLGAGQVVPGFDRGVKGMRVGGRRQVIIPPDLGYGAQGQGPIPANSTLIFVIDLVKTSPAPAGGGGAAAP